MRADLAKTGDYITTTSDQYHYWPADYITTSETQAYEVTSACILTPPWPVGWRNWGSDTGTIAVTHGSTTVTGSGTAWTSVSNHGMISVLGATGYNAGDDTGYDPTAHAYVVSSIDSATQLTLSVPYTGESGSGKRYLMGDYLCLGHGNVGAILDYGIGEDAYEYTAEHHHMPTWGIGWGYGDYYATSASPAGKGWYTGATTKLDHKYQPTFLQATGGGVLLALVLGMQTDWNHDMSIYYADRVATVNARTSDWWHPWLRAMWDEYRSDYSPTPWIPKCHTPVPSTSATGVSTSQVLSWYDGNGRASGTSCDVWIGTSVESMVKVASASTAYSLAPELVAGTTYWWRVDEVCPGGTYTGDTWSFTTDGEEPPPPTKHFLFFEGS
jgi:hypothetical protein